MTAVIGSSVGLIALSALGSATAYADTACPNAVGVQPVIVCSSVTNQPVPVPAGGTTVIVGGQTVGPIGGGTTTTPPVTVSTPAVPVNSPTLICYAVNCIQPGQTIATVPGQTATVPALSVPLPPLVPATTVPAVPVTVPATVAVPVPTVWLYQDPTGPLVSQAQATVDGAKTYALTQVAQTQAVVNAEVNAQKASALATVGQTADAVQAEEDYALGRVGYFEGKVMNIVDDPNGVVANEEALVLSKAEPAVVTVLTAACKRPIGPVLYSEGLGQACD